MKEDVMQLDEMMAHFFRLYERRNRIFLPGLSQRIGFLNLAIGDLQEAIRKEYGLEILKVALARIAARIFCVAEHFWSLPLIEAITQKYPAGHCSYCQKFPCRCPENRSNSILRPVSKDQLNWTLKQWQEHFNALYGKKNKKKGIENLLNRLSKEASELLSLQMVIPNTTMNLDEIEKEFALELADALAWTIAISNFFGIDLEEAVLQRFGKGCWKCGQIPCNCTGFNVKPVKWEDYSK